MWLAKVLLLLFFSLILENVNNKEKLIQINKVIADKMGKNNNNKKNLVL